MPVLQILQFSTQVKLHSCNDKIVFSYPILHSMHFLASVSQVLQLSWHTKEKTNSISFKDRFYLPVHPFQGVKKYPGWHDSQFALDVPEQVLHEEWQLWQLLVSRLPVVPAGHWSTHFLIASIIVENFGLKQPSMQLRPSLNRVSLQSMQGKPGSLQVRQLRSQDWQEPSKLLE